MSAEARTTAARADWRILVAVVGLVLSVLGPFVIPAEDRIAAALVCPRGATEPAVVSWETGPSGGGNGTRFHWTIYCVRSDGFAFKPGDLGIIARTTGGSLLLVLIVLGVMTVRRRAR